jgi:hypothetical protein
MYFLGNPPQPILQCPKWANPSAEKYTTKQNGNPNFLTDDVSEWEKRQKQARHKAGLYD